jgi:hypothetical protein
MFIHDINDTGKDPGIIKINAKEGFAVSIPVTVDAFCAAMAPHMDRFRLSANVKWDSNRPTYGNTPNKGLNLSI